MKTKQLYYENPYLKETAGKILAVEPSGSLVNVILDQTIFFPEGGGQPSDRGILESKNWSAKVEHVWIIDDEIIHQLKTDNEIKVGDEVEEKMDWNWRYKYMKIHSAGHLLHDILMEMGKELTPTHGSHGKKAFLEYSGNLDVKIKEDLEKRVNEAIANDLTIVTKEVSYKELEKECQFLPPNLPRTKKLRMIKIGDYPPMPDGGVHARSTKEIGKIWIANIKSEKGKVLVRYGVAHA